MNGELTFDLCAGALMRGQVKSEVQRACFREDLSCDVFESKGLLESTYSFRIKGDAKKLEEFKIILREWLISNGAKG